MKKINKVKSNIFLYLSTIFIFTVIVLMLASLYKVYNFGFKNHSKAIGTLGVPMTTNIMDFFKAHQRFPTLMESEKLFIQSGCNNIKRSGSSYICSRYSKNYIYILSAGLNFDPIPNTKDFSLSVKYNKTKCRSYFDKNGKIVVNFKCEHLPLIRNFDH